MRIPTSTFVQQGLWTGPRRAVQVKRSLSLRRTGTSSWVQHLPRVADLIPEERGLKRLSAGPWQVKKKLIPSDSDYFQ
jgi:hypothetical protein